jgi:Tfp pilus assembly protein PilV
MTMNVRNTRGSPRTSEAGFTYVEVLIAGVLLAFALFSMCGMFLAGYANVNTAGRTTMGLSAARQLMEDVRQLPFASLPNLNGFDTDDPGTLPEDDPEREVARRWRYALAGEGVGWDFTDDEIERWPDLADQGDPLGAAGTVTVTPRSGTLTEVSLTISVPGRWRDVRISTLITNEL